MKLYIQLPDEGNIFNYSPMGSRSFSGPDSDGYYAQFRYLTGNGTNPQYSDVFIGGGIGYGANQGHWNGDGQSVDSDTFG
jgi:hypothetical protein